MLAAVGLYGVLAHRRPAHERDSIRLALGRSGRKCWGW
jgi:hypothetical protein